MLKPGERRPLRRHAAPEPARLLPDVVLTVVAARRNRARCGTRSVVVAMVG
jgi:hypothetical protein